MYQGTKMEGTQFARGLKKAMKEQGMTGEKLGNMLGVSKSTVIHWSNGRRFPQKEEHISKMLDILSVTPNDLFLTRAKPIKPVPIVGTASCGSLECNVLQENDLKTYTLEENWTKNLYAVIACGDSMATEIYDGDICIIDPEEKAQSGDIVFYRLDDEGAIKVFYDDEENNLLHFIPFNSSEHFKTRTIRKDDEVLLERLTFHKAIEVVSSKKNNRSARLKMVKR